MWLGSAPTYKNLISGLFTTIEPNSFVRVGDVGNSGFFLSSTIPQAGSVSYPYQISKYSITNNEYCLFLNCVDPLGTNPNSIYNTLMNTDARGGISLDTTSRPAGYRYRTKTSMGDKPANYITWADAARFCNWLHNGAKRYKSSDNSATAPQNTGAYNIGSTENPTTPIAPSTNSIFRIPSIDEWLKAGYYKADSSSAGFWQYPTQRDDPPRCVSTDPSGNVILDPLYTTFLNTEIVFSQPIQEFITISTLTPELVVSDPGNYHSLSYLNLDVPVVENIQNHQLTGMFCDICIGDVILPLITINQQPPATIKTSETSATISIDASVTMDETLSYQWQKKPFLSSTFSDIPGATSSTLNITNLDPNTDDRSEYRCKLSATGGATDLLSSATQLILKTLFTITQQPLNTTTASNRSASFNISVTTTPPTPLYYLWEVASANDPNNFTTISSLSNTNPTLSLSNLSYSNNNNIYRCKLVTSDNTGFTYSNTAQLTVTPATITIFAHPSAFVGPSGGSANIQVSASVNYGGVISYQWQRKPDGGSYSDIPGATFSTLSLTGLTSEINNNDRYRCLLSATEGASSVYSNEALLVFNTSITVNIHPSNSFATNNGNVTFVCDATASPTAPLYYIWQKAEASAPTVFNDISLSNNTSPSITISNLTYLNDNNDIYRCRIVAEGNIAEVFTNTAILTVAYPNAESPFISITKQPKNTIIYNLLSPVDLSAEATVAFGRVPEDPYSNDVSLSLLMDGANNSSLFLDSSPNLLNVSARGNARLSTTHSRSGGSSCVLAAPGDYLEVESPTNFNFPNKFTIEFWVRISSRSTSNTLFSFGFKDENDNITETIVMREGGDPSQGIVLNNRYNTPLNFNWNPYRSAIPLDKWTHVAVSFSSNIIRVFVNGTQIFRSLEALGTTSNVLIIGQSINSIEQNNTSTSFLNGYIDNFRVTKNQARYTTNFVPGAPFPAMGTESGDLYFDNVSLLLGMDGVNNSTAFTDSSSNSFVVNSYGNAKISSLQSKFGGASCILDGNGDYLTCQHHESLSFGNKDFTIETWVRLNATGITQTIAAKWGDFGNDWLLRIENNNELRLYIINDILSGGQIPDNVWTHIAITRQSNTIKIFVNGTQTGSIPTNYTLTSTQPLSIGSYSPPGSGGTFSHFLNGYIDDFRITNGVARYTTPSFTPPASKLPAGDRYFNNTSLLLRMDGTNNSTTFIDSSPNNLTPIPKNNAKISTAYSKFSTSSARFDGSSELLIDKFVTEFWEGTDFTLECWIRKDNVPQTPPSVTFTPDSSTTIPPGAVLPTLNVNLSQSFPTAMKDSYTYWYPSSINVINEGSGFIPSNPQNPFWLMKPVLSSGLSLTCSDPYYCNTHGLAWLANRTVLPSQIVLSMSSEATGTGAVLEPVVVKAEEIFGSSYMKEIAISWSIQSVNIISGGSGYSEGDRVVLNVIDGTSNFNQFGATVSVNESGSIVAVNIDYYGNGAFYKLTDKIGSVFPYDSYMGYGQYRYKDPNIMGIIGSTADPNAGYDILSLGIVNNDLILYTGGSILTSASGVISSDVWQHIALSVQGTTFRLFVDGNLVSSRTISVRSVGTTSSSLAVGHFADDDGYWFRGYIDDFRITKNVARYTSNFSPPSSPMSGPVYGATPIYTWEYLNTAYSPPNVSQTEYSDVFLGKLPNDRWLNNDTRWEPIISNRVLFNFNTEIIDEGDFAFPVTNYGAQISPDYKKYGLGSLSCLNGYIEVDLTNTPGNSSKFDLNSDFTIEGWFYFRSNNEGPQPLICSHRNYGSDNTETGWVLMIGYGGTLGFYAPSSASDASWDLTVNTNFVPTTLNWHHICVTRTNGVIRLYANGTEVGSNSTALASRRLVGGATLQIGGYTRFDSSRVSFTSKFFNGYIDGVRLIYGESIYPISGFTPPQNAPTKYSVSTPNISKKFIDDLTIDGADDIFSLSSSNWNAPIISKRVRLKIEYPNTDTVYSKIIRCVYPNQTDLFSTEALSKTGEETLNGIVYSIYSANYWEYFVFNLSRSTTFAAPVSDTSWYNDNASLYAIEESTNGTSWSIINDSNMIGGFKYGSFADADQDGWIAKVNIPQSSYPYFRGPYFRLKFYDSWPYLVNNETSSINASGINFPIGGAPIYFKINS